MRSSLHKASVYVGCGMELERVSRGRLLVAGETLVIMEGCNLQAWEAGDTSIHIASHLIIQ